MWKVFIFIFFISSCSGYRLANQGNPFKAEGIESIAIPMFINHSSLPNMAPKFTKEFTSLFGSFPEIKLYQSENIHADALLIGIIESPAKRRDVFDQKSSQLTSGDLKTSIGARPEFFISSSVSYKLRVRLILIKNPRWQDIELVKSEIGAFIDGHPRVIINHAFEREGVFGRSIKSTESIDSEGLTNFTKTQSFMEKNLQNAARDMATNFKELVINVF